MKNNILTVVLIVLTISFVSCEDFLEKNPHDATEQEDILNNEADAQTLLNGVYASFKSSSSYGQNLTILTDIMTDATLAAAGFTNELGQMYAWNISPGTSEVGSVWGNHYSAIYNANFLINNIDKLDGDTANLSRIKGEALIARALLHHNLIRLFGKAYNASTAAEDLGIPYKVDTEVAKPKRNSVNEVYDFILQDIEQAIALLEPLNEVSDYMDYIGAYPDNMYFTQYFAKGLAARVALDMKNYDDVISYTSDVIDNSGCQLADSVGFVNMWLNDVGTEIIWKVGYSATDFGSAPGYQFFIRNNKENAPNPNYIPSEWLTNMYAQSNDVRANTYFIQTLTGYGWTGILTQKYPTNPMFDDQGTNMPKPMRLAEMVLMRAEAYAYTDMAEMACEDLDLLLNSRLKQHSGINTSGDPLKAFIANERIKELIYEGAYWYDLKRMNKGFQRVPQDNTSISNDLYISADDYRWQWPIPTAEINGNSNITQNEGY